MKKTNVTTSDPKPPFRLYILIIIFLGFLVFFNSLQNGFIGDDFSQIVDNTDVLTLRNIPQLFTSSTFYGGGGGEAFGLFYRPIMMSMYALIHTMFGLQPLFFHLVQLLFHITNAILVFTFLRYHVSQWIAWIAALIFLVHPVNSEAVLYIANLQDVLFVFFGLTALVLLQYEKLSTSFKSIIILFLLFLLTLLSKETGIVCIGGTILYTILFKKKYIQVSLISGVLATLFYCMLRFGVAKIGFTHEAISPLAHASLTTRLLHIPAIVMHYVKLIIFPHSLSLDNIWMISSFDVNNFWVPVVEVLLIGLIGYIIGRFIHKRGRKYFKVYVFFVAWVLAGLAVHLQLIPLEMTTAERWLYMPFMGVIGALAVLIQNVYIKTHRVQIGIALISVIIISLLSVGTFIRTQDWKDPITLYEHDLTVTPDNFLLLNNLATEYILEWEYEKAAPLIKKSVQIYPYYANLNNMALLHYKDKQYNEAKKYLQKALSLPHNFTINENYAKFLYSHDTPANTTKFITESLKNYPTNATLWLYLAMAQYKRNNKKDAVYAAQKAYEYNKSERVTNIYNQIKSGTFQ